MKPQQFKFLSDPGKLEFIKTACTLIGKRHKANAVYELYQCGELYIELQVYIPEIMVRQYFCFTDTTHLEPYLSKIDISELLNFG